MKPLLRKGILILGSVILLVVTFIVFRNIQFDKGVSALKSGDYDTAMRSFKPLAIIGDSGAQYLLGQMYAFGWGVPRDESLALKWLRKAGKWSKTETETETETETDKAASAAYYIGKDYAEGVGAVPKDELQAVKWFRIAADGGYRQAAELLGKSYSEGLFGLPRDQKQSEYWFQEAKGL